MPMAVGSVGGGVPYALPPSPELLLEASQAAMVDAEAEVAALTSLMAWSSSSTASYSREAAGSLHSRMAPWMAMPDRKRRSITVDAVRGQFDDDGGHVADEGRLAS
ncbi:MAG: hypothetical protein ACYCS2_10260 [Acidimicrobiales bacterium]